MLKRLVLGVAALVAAALVALFVTVQLRWDRTFEVPEPPLKASTDPGLIARGEYLVYGPALCAHCHVPESEWAAIGRGEKVPITGGYEWKIPPGTFRSTNLTTDPETGIGNMTDGQLARMIRYNIRHDGRAAIPFMEYPNMADDDIVAIISYLRTTAPVRNAIPDRELTFLGKAVMAFAIGPLVPEGPPLATAPPPGSTVERGGYLAANVAHCRGCHTARDLKDGSYVGPPYAGGMVMEIEKQPGKAYVTPNITPDPKTGVMAEWSEDDFVERFQDPSTPDGSHMAWASYAQMSEDDLRAIYRHIMRLKPVENDTGPLIQDLP